MVGRPPGYPKTGGARRGSVKTNTKSVKDAIREVFFDDLGGKAYLRKIAKKDEALFVSLLAKLIPQEIRAELDVRHHSFDMGKALAEAAARSAALSHITPLPVPSMEPQAIDHCPAPVEANTP
jgi:hypothetical protein